MLGIVCGLEAEAVIARRIAGANVVCSSARPENARSLARQLVGAGATRLLSFGLAGGLRPDLPAGTIIVGESVSAGNGRWECALLTPTPFPPLPASGGEGPSSRQLNNALFTHQCGGSPFPHTCGGRGGGVRWKLKTPNIIHGTIYGTNAIISTASDKRAIYEKTGCAAADMESHVVAEIAAESGIPFNAIRVIADTADMDIPPAALVPLRENGRIDIRRIMASIACHPIQLPELIRLGINTGIAISMLKNRAIR